MKYEGECIKTMEWVKKLKKSIKSKQTKAIALLLPMMLDEIKETINYSDEVWRRVYQNYGMSIIGQKLY